MRTRGCASAAWWTNRGLVGIRVSVCFEAGGARNRCLRNTYFVGPGVDKASGGVHALVEQFCGLFADGVGAAHLNIRMG